MLNYRGTNRTEINEPIIQYILNKRGIPKNEIHHYLNTTDDDINDYHTFGTEILQKAGQLVDTICSNSDSKIFIVVDADADGYTSSALLINWLNKIYGDTLHYDYYIHTGKQHGLNDCIHLIDESYDLVIVPDAGTNDIKECRMLADLKIPVIILDHHEQEVIDDNSFVCLINNQCSNYPNKEFSGVGIVWQFCRYMEEEFLNSGTQYYNDFLDILATGLVSDMMSLTSIETKHLINKGFQNLKNPFIFGMAKKNAFSIGDHLTPIGCAFYITPLINAIVRSGKQEEKELIFQSMLQSQAFKKIPSNKRGHKPGEEEYLYEQALRCATNVKNRQTKEQDNGLQFMTRQIEKHDMLHHKALVFFLEDDAGISPNIRGLIANKAMAQYQRPCAILTKSSMGYAGSARGYTKSGVDDFKAICQEFEHTVYAVGHANAFGLCIEDGFEQEFINFLDKKLANVGTDPIYYCDIVYQGNDIVDDDIITIADMSDLWGQDLPEPLICVENVRVKPDDVTIYNKRGNTIKITTEQGTFLKFKATDEECEELSAKTICLNIIGKANKNEWMGKVTPQIFIEDYEIVPLGFYGMEF